MSVSDTLINTLFDGRYRILRKLGAGGMANVYLAEDEDLGRRVAIKIMSDRYASDDTFNERFRREAKAAAALSHPNIVSIYDRGQADGTPYIAMEVIEGRSLKELILTRGPLPIRQAVEYTKQILAALRFAHRNGIIHRDIKPHNILVGAEDRLKVTDFGIARAGTSQMTEVGSIMGTAQYLSPEQARGAPVSGASDLYSVGVVLYEMLTGQVPFTGDTAIEIAMKHLNEAPKPPSELRPGIPPDLDRVVLRSLAKNPEDRYQSAEEFEEDLDRVVAGLPVAPETAAAAATVALSALPPTGATEVIPVADATARTVATRPAAPPRRPAYPPQYGYEEPPPRKRRSWVPWLIVILLLAAAAVAGWYVFTQIQNQLNSSKPVAVPFVKGIDYHLAERRIRDAGLTPIVVRQASDTTKVGIVFDQNPSGGTRISKGDNVRIFVSTGPQKVVVPDVVGLTFAQATKRLDDAGLTWNRRLVFSDKPSDQVLDQKPNQGIKVAKGSAILLTVSKGVQTVTVPDVRGEDQSTATNDLQAAGFQVAVNQVTSDQPQGQVVNQSPAGGTSAQKGSTVSIDVSKGPQTQTVPDVTGEERQLAKQRLEQAGFHVAVVTQDTTDATQDNIVISQDPAGGSQAQPGSTVTITVGHFTGHGNGNGNGNGVGRSRGFG